MEFFFSVLPAHRWCVRRLGAALNSVHARTLPGLDTHCSRITQKRTTSGLNPTVHAPEKEGCIYLDIIPRAPVLWRSIPAVSSPPQFYPQSLVRCLGVAWGSGKFGFFGRRPLENVSTFDALLGSTLETRTDDSPRRLWNFANFLRECLLWILRLPLVPGSFFGALVHSVFHFCVRVD